MALGISTGVRVDLQLSDHLEQDFIFRARPKLYSRQMIDLSGTDEREAA